MDITEITLHAWFDGELTTEQGAEVESQLREQPELAARARLWQADREALRAQCDALLHEPVPTRLTQAALHAAPRPAPLWRLLPWAAGVTLFVLGGVAGLLTGRGDGPLAARDARADWLARAAVAHAVYVPEKRHPVEVNVEQNQDGHLARWLTKRLDVPIKLFDLKAQGFELVGGRLLPDASGPSAQLMYQNDAGQRVTCYLRKSEAGPPDKARVSFRYERQGELGVFYWVENEGKASIGYALVGSVPREQLLVLAEAIYAQGEDALPSR